MGLEYPVGSMPPLCTPPGIASAEYAMTTTSSHSSSRKGWVITVILLVLIAGVGVFFREHLSRFHPLAMLTPHSQVGEVVQHRGVVFAHLDDDKRQLITGDPVYLGDRIVTQQHARLVIRMQDEAVIALGEETEFLVKDYQFSETALSGNGLLEMTRGFMRFTSGKLAKLKQRPFVVATPVATLGVRGTEGLCALVTEGQGNSGNKERNDDNKNKNDNKDNNEKSTGRQTLHCVATQPTVTMTGQGESGATTVELDKKNETVSWTKNASPEPVHQATREEMVQSYLMVTMPRTLTDKQVESLKQSTINALVAKGMDRQAATDLVNNSLDKITEEAAWNVTETEITRMLDEGGDISPEAIDARLSDTKALQDILDKVIGEVTGVAASSLYEAYQTNGGDIEKATDTLTWESEWHDWTSQTTGEATPEADGGSGEDAESEDGTRAAGGKTAADVTSDSWDQDQVADNSSEVVPEAEVPMATPVVKDEEPAAEGETTTISEGTSGQTGASGGEEPGGGESDGGTTTTGGGSVTSGSLVVISLSQDAVYEGSAESTAIGYFTTDLDATYTYSFSLADDASGRFQVEVLDGKSWLTVKDGTLLDYESDTSHPIDVQSQSTDGPDTKQNFTIRVLDVNEAPVATDKTFQINEGAANGTTVGTAPASDPDGDTLSYVFSTGNDAGLFAIDASTGKITVVDGSRLDYETKSSYVLSVTVTEVRTDGATPLNDTAVITITLKDNTAPTQITLSNTQVIEGPVNGAVVGTFSAKDPDSNETFTYTLMGDASGRFELDGDTLVVKDGSLIDYETTTSHTITVQVTDSDGNNYTTSFTLSVRDITLSANTVIEGSAIGTQIGQLAVSGSVSGETLTFDFPGTGVDSDAGGRFDASKSSSTWWLTVKDGTLLDYDAAASHAITVQLTDGTNVYHEPFTVLVLDNGIQLSGNQVIEGPDSAVVVGTVSRTGGASTDTFSLYDDAGGRFRLAADGVTLEVSNGDLLDYESATSHDVIVQVKLASGATYLETFTIQVRNIILNPNTVLEFSPNGTQVGVLAVADAGSGESFSFAFDGVGSNDAGGRFDTAQSGGAWWLTVKDTTLIVYATASSHAITVRMSDGATTYHEELTVLVIESNHVPTDITLSSDTVIEGGTTAAAVGTLTTTDEDPYDTFTYTLVDDAGGRFQLTGANLEVKNGSLIDYETATSHAVIVEVTDNKGNTFQKTLTIQVRDIALSGTQVIEGAETGVTVGTLSTAGGASGETLSYALTSDAGGRFQVSGVTLKVNTGTLIDYETATSHGVTVQVADGAGNLYNETFTITVRNISLSNNEVDEESDIGTQIGTFAVSGSGGTFSYDFPGGANDDDAGGRFDTSLQGGQWWLTVKNGVLLDYETATSHTITVQVSDGTWLYYETFVIQLLDIIENQPPTDIGLSASTVIEGAVTGVDIGTLTASDPDDGESFSYSLTDDAGGRFQINGDTLEVDNGTLLDYESATSHGITVRVTDSYGNTHDEDFTITLRNITLSSNTVVELTPTGTDIGIMTVAGAGAGETFTFDYPNDAQDDDAGGRFAISYVNPDWWLEVGNGILLDFHVANNHDTTVRMRDAAGNSYYETFNILVVLSPNCGDIPATPTVADMLANSRNTYTSIFQTLVAGGTATVTAAQFEEMIIGKANQQLTGGSAGIASITDVVSKFDVIIEPTEILAIMQIPIVDVLYNRLPATVQGQADGVFNTLAPYAPDYTVCVRVVIAPTMAGGMIGFDNTLSFVDVVHEFNLVPSLSFPLGVDAGNLIDEYNGILSDLAGGANPLKFFMGGANPPYHVLRDIMGDRLTAAAQHQAQSTAYPASAVKGTTSQSIPTSQRLDYYFPGLIGNVTINSGSVTVGP